MEEVRNILNYGAVELLNFYCDYPTVKTTITAMPAIPGEVNLQNKRKTLGFTFNGYLSRLSFNQGANPIWGDTNLISPDEFDAYRAANAAVLDALEAKAKEIIKENLITELDIPLEKFDALKINSLVISSAFKSFACSLLNLMVNRLLPSSRLRATTTTSSLPLIQISFRA